MNTDLVLVRNEPFGGITCNFYRNGDDNEFWMTREQIGIGLGYSNPRNAIKDIHSRYKNRLDKFSIDVPLVNVREGAICATLKKTLRKCGEARCRRNDGGAQKTVLYNFKGFLEICRHSNQPKANEFIDFVWSVMDDLMIGKAQLVPANTPQHPVQAININDVVSLVIPEVNRVMTEHLSAFGDAMDDGLDSIISEVKECFETESKNLTAIKKSTEYNTYVLKQIVHNEYDRKWLDASMSKVKLIAEFVNKEERWVLRELYRMMEYDYGVDLTKSAEDYKRIMRSSYASTLSVISYFLPLREHFDDEICRLLNMCGIEPPMKRRRDFELEYLINKKNDQQESSETGCV